MIADAVFVLASPRTYAVARSTIASALTRLVRLPHFKVQNRRIVLRALAIYGQTTVDFGDAMILSAMERQQSSRVYSYDSDFDRFPQIVRQEP